MPTHKINPQHQAYLDTVDLRVKVTRDLHLNLTHPI